MSYQRRRPRPLSGPDVTSRARFFPWEPSARARRRRALGDASVFLGPVPMLNVNGCQPVEVCAQAKAITDTLGAFYRGSVYPLIPAGDPRGPALQAKYGALVNDIMSGIESTLPFGVSLMPNCCGALLYGIQAQALIDQLAQDLGVAAPAYPRIDVNAMDPSVLQQAQEAASSLLANIGNYLKWGLIIGGAVLLGPPLLRSLEGRKTSEAT